MARDPISEYPTSLNLPPELKSRVLREAAKRGGLPLGPMLRLIVAEWIAFQDKRARKRKKIEAETPQV